MSHVRIKHESRSHGITVGTAVAHSTAFRMAEHAAGVLYVSGVTSTHTLAVYGSSDGQAYRAVYWNDGQPATIAVPADGGALALPDAAYPLRLVKLVSGTDLGTAASVTITLKS